MNEGAVKQPRLQDNWRVAILIPQNKQQEVCLSSSKLTILQQQYNTNKKRRKKIQPVSLHDCIRITVDVSLFVIIRKPTATNTPERAQAGTKQKKKNKTNKWMQESKKEWMSCKVIIFERRWNKERAKTGMRACTHTHIEIQLTPINPNSKAYTPWLRTGCMPTQPTRVMAAQTKAASLREKERKVNNSKTQIAWQIGLFIESFGYALMCVYTYRNINVCVFFALTSSGVKCVSAYVWEISLSLSACMCACKPCLCTSHHICRRAHNDGRWRNATKKRRSHVGHALTLTQESTQQAERNKQENIETTNHSNAIR